LLWSFNYILRLWQSSWDKNSKNLL
jgi:hypothetical protein